MSSNSTFHFHGGEKSPVHSSNDKINDSTHNFVIDGALEYVQNKDLNSGISNGLKGNGNFSQQGETNAIVHAQSKSNSNFVIGPASSIRHPLPTDESDDDFRPVTNKKKNSRKQTQIPSRSHPKSNVTSSIAVNATSVGHDDNENIRINTHANATNQEISSVQQVSITKESTYYAQSRYPFPPFILRFGDKKVSIKQVKEDLICHGKTVHQFEIQISNCRLANTVTNNNTYDILLFVKDVSSFCFLLKQENWPLSLDKENFFLPSVPTIPPQLCVLLKNVDIRVDFNDFCNDIRNNYHDVKNIIRMKNQFQNDIKLVKLELTSPTVRDVLLNRKHIVINYISYELTEYLASATVLICSKCLGLGHFRKNCSQVKESCRTWSWEVNQTSAQEVIDMFHRELSLCARFSKQNKSTHNPCNGDHGSSSLKCPTVKAYRAELTRKLLHSNDHQSDSSNAFNKSFTFNSSNFPGLPVPKASTVSSSNNLMLSKLDDLLGKLSQVKDHINALEVKYDKFEQHIIAQNERNGIINEKLNKVSNDYSELRTDVVQHDLLITRHENLFVKLSVPMFQDLFSLIAAQNQDKQGNPLDADLKYRLERYLVQMKKVTEGKPFTN